MYESSLILHTALYGNVHRGTRAFRGFPALCSLCLCVGGRGGGGEGQGRACVRDVVLLCSLVPASCCLRCSPRLGLRHPCSLKIRKALMLDPLASYFLRAARVFLSACSRVLRMCLAFWLIAGRTRPVVSCPVSTGGLCVTNSGLYEKVVTAEPSWPDGPPEHMH
jgi:hypothetical protein